MIGISPNDKGAESGEPVTSHCAACLATNLNPCITVQHTNEPSRSTLILRCSSCGTGRTAHEINEIDVQRKNDALYEAVDEYNKRGHSRESRQRFLDDATWTVKRIGAPRLPRLKRFLDIGCSAGGTMLAFAELGYDAYGVEPSSASRHAPPQLASRIQNCYLGQEVFEKPFGIITAFHVLEHVPDPAVFLAHSRGLMVPRGILVIEVPDFNFALRRLRGHPTELFSHISPVYHINHFTLAGLDRLLNRTGFAVLKRDRVATYVRQSGQVIKNIEVVESARHTSDGDSSHAWTLKGRLKDAVWKFPWVRMMVRHTLAHTLGLGRYIRVIAQRLD